MKNTFRNSIAENVFRHKYAISPSETWQNLAERVVEDVVGTRWGETHRLIDTDGYKRLVKYISEFKFVPGGRYLYYAGRPLKAYNNCFTLKAKEDTREEWARLAQKAMLFLTYGGGIGIDYSVIRPAGKILKRTGGLSSGVIPLMNTINEIGRNVMQGGSRRSAIYASLCATHEDINEFLHCKDWNKEVVNGITYKDIKKVNFDFPAPLDMTNISINYNYPEWLDTDVFKQNVLQAMKTGEPGFSFNLKNPKETCRNACVTGDTLILTKKGYVPIIDTIGDDIEIWNGKNWSNVKPFYTGDREIYIVELSDGNYLKCTDNHKFVTDGGEFVELKDLKVGTKLIKAEFPIIPLDEEYDVDAYSQGFYAGDGNKDYTYSYVYDTKYCCLDRLCGEYSLAKDKTRVVWKHGKKMLPKEFVPINSSIKFKINWLAGLFDSDGCVVRYKNSLGVQISSINYEFLRQINLLLNTLGCAGKVSKIKDAEGNLLPDGRAIYRMLINAADINILINLGLKCNRLDLSGNMPNRDARQFVRVVNIIKTGNVEPTFCFTEPERHMGVFNGVLTGQCAEVVSEDDSDVCNLGSVNIGIIDSLEELADVCYLGGWFLAAGTIRGVVPDKDVEEVRKKNRRLGLGLMGVHEFLLKRQLPYAMNDTLKSYLEVYKTFSEKGANDFCDRFFLNRPVAYRAIAPTGTIGLIAGTTTGIEPLYAVAYKRRYLQGNTWKYEYVIDTTAKYLIEKYSINPEDIETALTLSNDIERRIAFQAAVQEYVDMGISSTINLPAWGTENNNEDKVDKVADIIKKYAHILRGLTFYPDGSRGGQPLEAVPYEEAFANQHLIFEEHDSCKGGVCGL